MPNLQIDQGINIRGFRLRCLGLGIESLEGQQPLLQGFWPVMQLWLEIDRGISAANLDTRAQLVTGETVGDVGGRFEN